MGSATTQALAASTDALAAASGLTLDSAAELFAAARALGESAQLSGALADPAAPAQARTALVSSVFAGASAPVRSVLTAVAGERWSSASDLVDGVEELAIRTAAIASANDDVAGELFGFSRVVAANPELELALGTRLGDSSAKAALVENVLGASAVPATVLIAASLVRQPRERRVRQLLSRAIGIVSAQAGRTVATVYTAAPIAAAQQTRLRDALARRYGGEISINQVVDPSIVGGLRVQIADDVIDGSISARLADLRQKLAS
ncbi:F0F1 ATP synthase subunit delta [Microbacterium sp. YJN-G]|uniref:F0F1 ATP synthase subunit delta n=1 Tax=Microbacterium sp. YJN-G TaxID=2763257 RepID=UPI001878BB2C|nr:F0F1 ATP synthase subunit delta [Microbacterium sp. YJN-G]